MAPKAKVPAPIDRPLSRAYLREFSGWSTAYPPGLSDPTSLRIMENMLVNRDGSLRVRPGLRYLSYTELPEDDEPGVALDRAVIGSHEVFFLNDGSKAYLFAVREDDLTVGFRVLQFNDSAAQVHMLDDPAIGFTIDGVIAFSPATTYVKYLQIDNKIFALSDAGEPMRYFTVGTVKAAKSLGSIEVPAWRPEDKLDVFHPDATWINGGVPTGSRTNLMMPPSFEGGMFGWRAGVFDFRSKMTLDTAQKRSGVQSMRLESVPLRTNFNPEPLHNLAVTGLPVAWVSSTNGGALTVSGGKLRMEIPAGAAGRTCRLQSPRMYIDDPTTDYRFSFDLDSSSIGDFKLLVRCYSAANKALKDITVDVVNGVGHHNTDFGDLHPNTAFIRCWPTLEKETAAAGVMTISNVLVTNINETGAFFDGDSGSNYYWTGTPNNSISVYHPPQDVTLVSPQVTVVKSAAHRLSAYVRGTVAKFTSLGHQEFNSGGSVTASDLGSPVPADTGAWGRQDQSFTTNVATAKLAVTLIASNLARGEYIWVDDVLLERGASLNPYFDGDFSSTPTVTYAWTGTARNSSSTELTYSSAPGLPTPETPAVDTLVSSGTADHANLYNFGLFYTFDNEVGESAASMVRTLRTMRAWGQWKMELPNASGEPNGTPTAYPERSADQLVAVLPQAVFDQAVAQGALNWSVYLLTWSNQDNVPTEAVKIAEVDLTASQDYNTQGWVRITAQAANAGGDVAVIPTINNRYNYSNPSTGGNGLVAADRMVLVKDPNAAAVIRWTSNKQGEYTNFSAIQGGGYKTLTSGNLYIPACVKLWQNPQSADTLTILCQGVDGMSTGYYMAPATVTSQSDTTQIMAFEETTATPGTSSPYGCEVFNNALYHPLDEQLMKSTASNYNINHKSLTDQIEFDWYALSNKRWIISSQHENRLYFIVHNPKGELLLPGCNGNEVWIYDAASETGTWSRFLIQAHSLRKIEQGGRVYMSVTRPDGIFYLDPEYDRDDVVLPESNVVSVAPIPWRFETNVQGANRAHDAWAMLQQMEMVLGNFQGAMQWGLRSWDVNGKSVLLSKIKRDLGAPSDNGLPWDVQDKLLVRKGLQEWFLFASSVVTDGQLEYSSGQINSVQYRYAPLSVNDGYERGSVETFEYGRETADYGSTRTDAGVPQPFTDTRRP